MSQPSKTAHNLRLLIKQAIADEKITPEERDRIMLAADHDGIVDREERALLCQLQDMIHSGAIRLAGS